MVKPYNPDQPELWPEFGINTTWFHVLRGMILEGRIAELGVNAWAVYCVIKAHTDMKTGDAFPDRGRIADLIGVSHDTVDRALKQLIKQNIIEEVGKVGRTKKYRLIEEIPMSLTTTLEQGQVTGTGAARMPYAGLEFGNVLQQLKAFAETGVAVKDGRVEITLNVQVNNVNVAPGGVANIAQNASTDSKPQTYKVSDKNLSALLKLLNKPD